MVDVNTLEEQNAVLTFCTFGFENLGLFRAHSKVVLAVFASRTIREKRHHSNKTIFKIFFCLFAAVPFNCFDI